MFFVVHPKSTEVFLFFVGIGLLSFAQVLHSGGAAALRDLVEDSDALDLNKGAFFKGPAAFEFLGEQVPDRASLTDLRTTDENSRVLTRFYSRAAIVFWPRAHT